MRLLKVISIKKSFPALLSLKIFAAMYFAAIKRKIAIELLPQDEFKVAFTAVIAIKICCENNW